MVSAADSNSDLGVITPRHREIVKLVADGYSNHEIGCKLGISKRTVKNHLTTIYDRLEIYDRVGLVVYALKAGWVVLDELEIQRKERIDCW